MVANRPHDARFNMAVRWELPAGTLLDDGLASLRLLIERHEILRTRFAESPGEPPTQVVDRRGVHPVLIVDAAGQDRGGSPVDPVRDLAARRFEPTQEYPARFCVAVLDGRALWLGAALSHLAVDAAGTEILRRDLRAAAARMAGAPDPEPGRPAVLQPLDQAEGEQSSAGRAASRRAAELWRQALTGTPASLPEAPSLPAADPAFPARLLCARGLGARAQELADRLDVGISAVFIGAATAALAAHQGVDAQSVVVTCGNRMARRMAGYAGTVAQQGVIRLDSLGAPASDVITRTWEALLTVHESSAYEPADVNRVLRELTGKPHVGHYVNFVEEHVPLHPTEVFQALGRDAWVTVPGPTVTSSFLRYGLTLVANQEDVVLRMFADGRLMSATAIDGVLDGVRTRVAGSRPL
ncbi:hypothetical protein E1265_06720 [Streptomyces sp. 8K308]|uniref:condensation domain-containing protein n=1 Tax=Streptomyces sp. 8K308 TaxID=2530388 RepID=UPI001049CDEE|nr:condensation domain-containing protein [Streptomyces sp. 8K308]TDC25557.1 hypothetical protein E1265_06720 [Streptomyces sp. 8K308]